MIPDALMLHRLRRGGPGSLLFTFDDGPSESITPLVLEKLKKNRVRALFFVVGKFAESYPGILRKISGEGHIIGNHSFYHTSEPNRSVKEYREEIRRCQGLIEEITGEKPRYYRPPMGRLSLRSLSAAAAEGLTTMLWSVEGHEWTRNKGKEAEAIGKELINDISAKDIILLHDNNNKVPAVLDLILPSLIEKGYDLFNGFEYL